MDDKAMLNGNGEPMTVLVVDDVADFRGYVARVLQILGYNVWQAEDGPSAMALCESRGRPDMAVLDVSLPGLNGPEVAQHLQKRCGDLGVVFMSGYAAHYLRDQGILPDGALFLRKPFTLPDVAQALDQVIATQELISHKTADMSAFCSAAE
jgi:CheY-like chemotaxis protein